MIFRDRFKEFSVSKAILTIMMTLLLPITGFSLTGMKVKPVPPTKKNIFALEGIFQGGDLKTKSVLKKLRFSAKKRSSERVVFDFGSKGLPETYIYLSSKEGKINLDFGRTKLQSPIKPFFSSDVIKEVNFFPLAEQTLAAEIFIKKNVPVEVFYLKNPTRLVIDFKKN